MMSRKCISYWIRIFFAASVAGESCDCVVLLEGGIEARLQRRVGVKQTMRHAVFHRSAPMCRRPYGLTHTKDLLQGEHCD